jgi:hypothetical protein
MLSISPTSSRYSFFSMWPSFGLAVMKTPVSVAIAIILLLAFCSVLDFPAEKEGERPESGS